MLFVSTEIWVARTYVGEEHPTESGIPDQTSVNGPTLVAGDRVVYQRSDIAPGVYEVAAGTWTLVHVLAIGEHAQITWPSYIGAWEMYKNMLLTVGANGFLEAIGAPYTSFLIGECSTQAEALMNAAIEEAQSLALMLGGM